MIQYIYPTKYANSDALFMSDLFLHSETIQTALAKQLGEILDFALKFDELKMTKPALQNDFSYYRRLMPKRHIEELMYAFISPT